MSEKFSYEKLNELLDTKKTGNHDWFLSLLDDEKQKMYEAPIIMLSARGEEYDKINGFELGIDDYVVKPFSPKELMLRVEAIMKRVTAKVGDDKVKKPNLIVELDGGGLKADLTARIVAYITSDHTCLFIIVCADLPSTP